MERRHFDKNKIQEETMELTSSIRLFGRTKALEAEIDEFLNKLSESAMIFEMAIAVYLKSLANDEFESKLLQVNKLESDADTLRRSIEHQLYQHTLIPQSRGDVLGLVENLDHIINSLEGALWNFSIETPVIPTHMHEDFLELSKTAILAVEQLVQASRSFFNNINDSNNYTHKVMFYEKETDKISSRLKRAIFAEDIDLAHKMHLRSFVEYIDNIADSSEDVADRLAIYIIKRTV
jgi:uncharacterized protein